MFACLLARFTHAYSPPARFFGCSLTFVLACFSARQRASLLTCLSVWLRALFVGLFTCPLAGLRVSLLVCVIGCPLACLFRCPPDACVSVASEPQKQLATAKGPSCGAPKGFGPTLPMGCSQTVCIFARVKVCISVLMTPAAFFA